MVKDYDIILDKLPDTDRRLAYRPDSPTDQESPYLSIQSELGHLFMIFQLRAGGGLLSESGTGAFENSVAHGINKALVSRGYAVQDVSVDIDITAVEAPREVPDDLSELETEVLVYYMRNEVISVEEFAEEVRRREKTALEDVGTTLHVGRPLEDADENDAEE